MSNGNAAAASDKRLQVHLAEYESLKAEQLKRIASRDNSVYLTIAAIAAVGSFFKYIGHPALLLLVGWVCILLGWHFLMNDLKVSHIGDYIRDELDPRIQKLAGFSSMSFEWEHFHSEDRFRLLRKIYQTCIDLLAFVAPGVTTIVVFFIYTTTQKSLYAGLPLTTELAMVLWTYVSYGLAVAIVLYIVQLIIYSRYAPHPRAITGSSSRTNAAPAS